MKAVVFAFIVSLSACATTSTTSQSKSHPVNVAAVRTEIKSAIEAAPGDAGPRTIYSMGKVTQESAVVYTEASSGRHEEMWMKGPQGWKLNESHAVAAAR
ncbi:MAG: hypothetical protein HOV81_03740 [Kofleriaceae bacterium]|nr:hypothetical protein [Kofleriaceae bacterium]